MKRHRKTDRACLRRAAARAKIGRPHVRFPVSPLLKKQILSQQVSDRKSAGHASVSPVGQIQREPEAGGDMPDRALSDSPGVSFSSTNGERPPQPCDQLGGHPIPPSNDSVLMLRSDAVPPPNQQGVESCEEGRSAEVQGLGSSLKVTIQRTSDSRAFRQTVGQTAGQVERRTAVHHCHLCDSSCPTLQAFQNHMTGTEHQTRLKEVAQLVKTAGTRGNQSAKQRWCDTCQTHFTGDVIIHRQTNQHKLCKQSSRPYCLVCKRHFRTPRKFVEHMKSPEHKQQVQQEDAQEELITVDAIGCFVGEERGVDKEEEAGEREKNNQCGEEHFREEEVERQEYNPDRTYGSSFVVPVTGFLCRLCQKFFHDEATARRAHCRTHTHYLNMQLHTSGNHGNTTHMHTSTLKTDTDT